MNDKIVDALENLIALNEMQAPLEDITAAVTEAQKMLDSLPRKQQAFTDWLNACPNAEYAEVSGTTKDGELTIVYVDIVMEEWED